MTTRMELSIEEFLACDWPAGTQLVDGEVTMNDPSFRHQEIVGRLYYALRTWCFAGEGRGTAGLGGQWTLAPGEVYIPDVLDGFKQPIDDHFAD